MMVSFGALFAQTDTIRTLVISELRGNWCSMNYLELTNMGDEALQLSEFEVVKMTPWNSAATYIPIVIDLNLW